MYKIRCLLLWILATSPLVLPGQSPGQAIGIDLPDQETMRWVQTRISEPTQLTNELYANMQRVFTAHQLAGQVEPGKK